MTRPILTDDAFHGGEPLPPRFIPTVTGPTAPTADRDAPAGEAPPAHPISPAGNSLRRARTGDP